MSVPSTADDFIHLVVQSGLVEASSLARYQKSLPPVGTAPAELARQLVHNGLLTRFQADQILLGTFRRFFIGKYKVLDRLGAGGMAQVYLCEHRDMRHRVAVKVLPLAKAEDPSALARFYREARASAALNHPNIVRANDVDQDEGLHFLVMEYVEGASLQEMVLRHGPLHPRQVVRYLRQAANGLQHAFEAGLVHRDIKPANLLVDHAGTVKILDLGLARFFDDASDNLSQEYKESVLGTADYLAPEQVEDAHNVDIRADIYSLGATFYFCLTGSPPFAEGSFTQKLIWHQTRNPKPIGDYRLDVPPVLVSLIEKMMAKDPAARFATPADVAAAAASIAADIPATGDTAVLHADGTRKDTDHPRPARGRKRKGKHRIRWVAVAFAAVAIGVGLALAYVHFPASVTAPPTSAPAPTTVTAAAPVPMLIVHCGRGKGFQEDELLRQGYGYRLIQGDHWEGWKPPAGRAYCWFHDQQLRFQIRVPAGTHVTLRLQFVDGDNAGRREKLIVQGKSIADLADFGGAGKVIDVSLTGSDTQTGVIDVTVVKDGPQGPNAVISRIELLAPPTQRHR